MNCQRCHAESLPGARVCINCRKPLSACTHRGGALPVAAKFCPDCGDALHRERRFVTVLFCDLVGSTKLASRLDPEHYSEIMKTFQDTCAEVVTRFDGYVAERPGDGLLVCFGWPEAHEDEAGRAVRAGLGILEVLRRVQPRGVSLSARITMDQGWVVVDEAGGVTGEPLNKAAHVKNVADPNTIVITESVRQQRSVENQFDVYALGAHALKEGDTPAVVYRVLGEMHPRDAAGPAKHTPLMGRDDDLHALRDLWKKAKTGRGQVVLLGGEAGIGKSRLVHALKEDIRADEQNAWLNLCKASSRFQNTAFHPIIDLLERAVFERGAKERTDEKLHELEAWLAESGEDLAEAVPLFAQLLSLPLGQDRFTPPTVDGGDLPLVSAAELKKGKTQQILLRILRARASTRPVLFVVEDLHWADASTLELMKLLLQDVARFRILVVLTFRPEEYAPPEKAPWASSDYVTRKILGRLDRDSSTQIANMGGAPLPDKLLEQVLARADGNPLFIEELSKWVREVGVVGEKTRAFEIPATLQSSLAARLDRLAEAKAIAQTGAVLGREFSYDLLRAVSKSEDAALTDALDQLVNAGILYQSGLPPTSRYEFKHALIQNAAYDAILKAKRPEQHRQIAEVLKQRFADLIVKQPELIAHHYAEGELTEQAIPYLEQAAQRALDRAANIEAIAHLSKALEFLAAVPASQTRDQLELKLRDALAPAYMAIKGWASDEVEETCGRARILGKLLGDFDRTYAAQWGRWTNRFLRGRLDEALETSLEVMQMAADAGAPMLRVTAHHAVGYSHFYRGEFLQVRDHALQAEPLFSANDERAIIRTFQFSSTAALRIMHGSSLWMLGFPDQAPDRVQSGIALTRELAHEPSEAFALAASLLLHAYNLDVDGAGETAETLRRLAKKHGNEIWGPFAAMFNGWVLVERGEGDRGLDEMRSGIAGWQGARNHLNQTIVMAMLGRSLWKAGRREEALETLDTEVKASQARHELQFAPELHRLKGEILFERGATADSEACFESALALARGQNALMLELRAATNIGRVWMETGRRDAAQRLVADVYGRFTEGFGTADLRAAQELLEQLARTTPAATPRPGAPRARV